MGLGLVLDDDIIIELFSIDPEDSIDNIPLVNRKEKSYYHYRTRITIAKWEIELESSSPTNGR